MYVLVCVNVFAHLSEFVSGCGGAWRKSFTFRPGSRTLGFQGHPKIPKMGPPNQLQVTITRSIWMIFFDEISAKNALNMLSRVTETMAIFCKRVFNFLFHINEKLALGQKMAKNDQKW